MEPDPVRASNTRKWLSLAREDLDNADHDLKHDPPFVMSAVFHCQQAAEKALKGFLTLHDIPFRKVHDLEELGKQCRGVDSTLAQLAEKVEPLTKYASQFRYPGALCEPSLQQGQAALALAREVMEALAGRVPPEARP